MCQSSHDFFLQSLEMSQQGVSLKRQRLGCHSYIFVPVKRHCAQGKEERVYWGLTIPESPCYHEEDGGEHGGRQEGRQAGMVLEQYLSEGREN